MFLSKHTFGNLVTFALDPTFPFAAVGEFRGVFLRLLLPLDAREAAFFGLTIGSPSCCSRAGALFRLTAGVILGALQAAFLFQTIAPVRVDPAIEQSLKLAAAGAPRTARAPAAHVR